MTTTDNPKITEILTRLAAELVEAAEEIHTPRFIGLEARLGEAASLQSLAEFSYKKPGDTQFTSRVVRVEHYGTSAKGGEQYINGWDYDRQEYRTFRLARIKPGTLKVAS